MEKLKSRCEIDDQYKWSINEIFANDEEIKQALEKLEIMISQIYQMKGHIMDSAFSLQHYYEKYNEFDQLLTKLYVYAHMKRDEDTKNATNQALCSKIDKAVEKFQEKLSFIGPEMLKTPYQIVKEYIEENKDLEVYQFDLESMYRYQDHTLSEREEEIITKAHNAMGTGTDAFYNLNNADIHYGNVINQDGKEIELTNGNYVELMNSRNRDVRKNTFQTMYAFWKSVTNTVAATLKGQVKEDFFTSNIHQYESPLVNSLYSDNISKNVYTNLIETVHHNLHKMDEYIQIRKKILNIEELHMYDIYVDLVKKAPKKISFEEGKKILFEGLKPLGDQYLDDLKKAFDEHWIDIYPNIGKKSGAYSWGCYGTKPYLLLNYDETIDSVSTMAHELGHSMHSYYSLQNQPYIYSSYPIFLAEIASTVNEILLNEYLYQNATTKEEKMLYLTDFLDKVRTTIYRQTMFAEFEMLIHDKEQKGIPLTSEEFCNTYYQLNQEYYGKNVVSDFEIRYEWERIPHFYTPFYTYQYATGMSAAISIAHGILNHESGMKERYLEFLSSGGSNYPLEILKKVGIDMNTSKPIQTALDVFQEKLEELKNLCCE